MSVSVIVLEGKLGFFVFMRIKLSKSDVILLEESVLVDGSEVFVLLEVRIPEVFLLLEDL